jgi:hypothetical protein
MSQELYYTSPSDEIFEEMRAACIKVWQEYDNTHGYVDKKVNSIKDIENIGDNFMYMFAMFDHINQQKVMMILSPGAQAAIRVRLE